MSTWIDDFTIGADTNLGSRADWINFDHGNFADQLRDYSATGRVYGRLATVVDSYRFTRAGLPTGTQEVRMPVFFGPDASIRFSGWLLQSDSGSAATLNGYEIEVLSGVEVRMKRWVNGVSTQIAVGLTPGINVAAALRFRATVVAGVSVDLEAQIDAGSTLTFSDTNASRPTSGRPGLGYQGDNAGTTYIDSFTVDDLITITTPPMFRGV